MSILLVYVAAVGACLTAYGQARSNMNTDARIGALEETLKKLLRHDRAVSLPDVEIIWEGWWTQAVGWALFLSATGTQIILSLPPLPETDFFYPYYY